MKNKIILSLLSLLSLLMNKTSEAQEPVSAKLSGLFKAYRSKAIEEKVYAHTDKESYLAGETIWFKLYDVDAGLHQPLSISKLAYVELLNSKHIPVLQAKVELSGGSGQGLLELPSGLASGNYVLRAYTSWMKNFDPDFYFEKNVAVLNTLSEEPIELPVEDSSVYDIQFFPEGGNMVRDIEGKLGFRVVDKSGKGVEFAGAVLDQKGDTVARFRPLFRGIGSFELLPAAGASYTAVLTMRGGNKIMKAIPAVAASGYSLRVESAGQRILVKVRSKNAEPNEAMHLFVHGRGSASFILSGSMKDNLLQFSFEKDSLREGISHITLFNDKMQPLGERLFFKPFTNRLMVSATPDRKIYPPRRKVVIDVETKDETGLPLPSDLSISVFYKDTAIAMRAPDIESYLHLSSDLKGNIEDPSYYFSGIDANVSKALDNLMLTQGWRRFIWQDVVYPKNEIPQFLPEIEGHIISGNTINRVSGKPAPNMQAFLSVPGKKNQLYSSVSNSVGAFNFYTKNFYGVKEIVVQPGTSGQDLQINLASPFSEMYSSRYIPPFNPFAFNTKDLQQKSVNMQVQKAYHAQPEMAMQTTDTVSFYGTPEKKYLLDDYVRFPTMQEVLREYVTEINVYERNKSLGITLIRRYADGTAYKKDPLVMIDGVPLLGDQNKLFRYNPLDVKELHIINHDYFLGTAKTEGIVNFVTYKGLPPSMELDPQTTVVDYEGLQVQREFFQPVYETPVQVTSRMPDFRSLLLWNPVVKTGAAGKTQVSFYTSDLPGNYTIVLQGLAGNGTPGSKVTEFEVVR